LPSEQYNVRAEPEVSNDLTGLLAVDEDLVDRAISLMKELRQNPWSGDDLWERYNLRPLADCRKIRFDLPSWQGRPRYRIVYRNEPLDGAPGLVRVWSAAPRTDLIPNARAATPNPRAAARTRLQPRRRGL
jgi:hypothetical protein